MLSMTTKAQFILATNSDVLNSVFNIENTGNAVSEFFYQPIGIYGDMRVSVCDGNDASFVWSATSTAAYTDGILNFPLGITDPDVALGEKGQVAMVVYEVNGGIYLEQYQFNVLNNGFFLMDGPLLIGAGENPNIDIYSYNGTIFKTVIVWQDGNTIKTRTTGGSFGSITAEVQVNLNTSYDYQKPDVSIRGSGTSGGVANPMLISYTYVEHSTNNNDDYLIVQQEWFNDVVNNTLTNNVISLGLKRTLPGEQYGHPRIATPWQLISSTAPGFNDFSVVVDRTNGSDYFIESVTSNGGILSSMGGRPVSINYFNSISTSLPPPINISTDINKKPALDYIGDNIIIAWTYFDGPGNTPGAVTYEVLQRKLYLTGSPAASYYSVVNLNNQGNQTAVSVASRYSTQSQVLYSFNTYDTDLAFKYSSVGNSSLRLAHQSALGVYPNPFSENLHIELSTENNKIELFDMHGRLVYSFFTTKKSTIIKTDFLSCGLYLLKISNATKVQTQIINKY